jgi:hypothetical protein
MGCASDRTVALDALSRRVVLAVLLCACACGAQAQNKCSASGLLGGEKFTANHCAAALYSSQHSVAIWFNEDPISAKEAEDFQASAAVDPTKNGKQRTLFLITFCPGGGAATASAAAVKLMRLNTNHAKSVLAGIQWTVKAPRDFKVESLSGEIQPGGTLAGKIAGKWHKTTWNLAFDVKLPKKDAETGMSCDK